MASTITRWRPLADLSELRDRLDQVFAGSGESWNPRIDVVKNEGEIGNTVDGVLELRIPLPRAEQKPKQTVKVHPKKS